MPRLPKHQNKNTQTKTTTMSKNDKILGKLSSAWNWATDTTVAGEKAVSSTIGRVIEAPFDPLLQTVKGPVETIGKTFVLITVLGMVLLFSNRNTIKNGTAQVYSDGKSFVSSAAKTAAPYVPYAAGAALLL